MNNNVPSPESIYEKIKNGVFEDGKIYTKIIDELFAMCEKLSVDKIQVHPYIYSVASKYLREDMKDVFLNIENIQQFEKLYGIPLSNERGLIGPDLKSI